MRASAVPRPSDFESSEPQRFLELYYRVSQDARLMSHGHRTSGRQDPCDSCQTGSSLVIMRYRGARCAY